MKTALAMVLTPIASPIFAQSAAKKIPVPGDAAQAEATKLNKEVYGDEWAKAKTKTEKQALAKKLLGKATGSKDDPASSSSCLDLPAKLLRRQATERPHFRRLTKWPSCSRSMRQSEDS